MSSELHVLVYIQNESGGRAKEIYTTPINNIHEKTPNFSDKAKIKSLIVSINAAACQGNVAEDYIKSTAVNNQILMILHRKEIVSRTIRGVVKTSETIIPIGFISSQYADDNGRIGYYIDVICSKSNGTQLLDYFVNFAIDRGATFVGLSSLPSVLSYYPKHGFEFRKTCDGEPLATLPETINEYIRRTKTGEVKMPKTSNNVYEIDPYMNFMIELHEKDLSVKKDGECSPKMLTKNMIKTADCGQSGYSMKKCFYPKRTVAKTPNHIVSNDDVNDTCNMFSCFRRRGKTTKKNRRPKKKN